MNMHLPSCIFCAFTIFAYHKNCEFFKSVSWICVKLHVFTGKWQESTSIGVLLVSSSVLALLKSDGSVRTKFCVCLLHSLGQYIYKIEKNPDRISGTSPDQCRGTHKMLYLPYIGNIKFKGQKSNSLHIYM